MAEADVIPIELKRYKAWAPMDVNKMPVVQDDDVGLTSRDWNNPKKWFTYDEVCEINKAEPSLPYHSFILSKEDPFVVIDLDNPPGLHDWLKYGARENLLDANHTDPALWIYVDHIARRTYTETSVSGNGLHIFLRTDWTFSSKLKNQHSYKGMEVFYANKQINVTGMKISYSPSSITKNDEWLADIMSMRFPFFHGAPAKSRPLKIGNKTFTTGFIGNLPGAVQGARHSTCVSSVGKIANYTNTRAVLLRRAMEYNEQKLDPPLGEDEIQDIVNYVWARAEAGRECI